MLWNAASDELNASYPFSAAPHSKSTLVTIQQHVTRTTPRFPGTAEADRLLCHLTSIYHGCPYLRDAAGSRGRVGALLAGEICFALGGGQTAYYAFGLYPGAFIPARVGSPLSGGRASCTVAQRGGGLDKRVRRLELDAPFLGCPA